MCQSAPVAQLDRASPSEGGDCAFESRRVRQKFNRRMAAIWTRGVRQQVDLPNDSFGKSSRLPRSRHECVVRGNPPGAPEIQPPYGGLIYALHPAIWTRGVRQQVDLPNDSFGKSSRLPRSRHECVVRGNQIQPPYGGLIYAMRPAIWTCIVCIILYKLWQRV